LTKPAASILAADRSRLMVTTPDLILDEKLTSEHFR
jgi:hypothetical protein